MLKLKYAMAGCGSGITGDDLRAGAAPPGQPGDPGDAMPCSDRRPGILQPPDHHCHGSN